MLPSLNPCPFCGSRKASIRSYHGIYFVGCEVCHADGPAKDTELEAAKTWNARPEPKKGDGDL